MCSVCLQFCPLKAGFCICVQCVYKFVLWRQGSVYVFSVFTSLSSEGRVLYMCSVCFQFCPLKAGFCICVHCVYKFVL